VTVSFLRSTLFHEVYGIHQFHLQPEQYPYVFNILWNDGKKLEHCSTENFDCYSKILPKQIDLKPE
jgi:hypothetical protein